MFLVKQSEVLQLLCRRLLVLGILKSFELQEKLDVLAYCKFIKQNCFLGTETDHIDCI